MDDNRVSACDGTATIVLVCRTVSPSGARHFDFQTDTRIQAPFQLRRTLVGLRLRLKPTWRIWLFNQIPPKTSGKVELCDHARSRRMPEVITSRAPATECLHAHARVARMSWLLYGSDPRTPIACRWCLYSIRRAAFRTAFPGVSSWCDAERGDSLLEFHAHRWGACMHGALHVLVIHG